MSTDTMEFDCEQMKEAMRQAMFVRKSESDVIVTTSAIYERLKEYVASLHPVPITPSGFESLSLYGMEILAYGDNQEATAAAIDLRSEGKRVTLVLEDENEGIV